MLRSQSPSPALCDRWSLREPSLRGEGVILSVTFPSRMQSGQEAFPSCKACARLATDDNLTTEKETDYEANCVLDVRRLLAKPDLIGKGRGTACSAGLARRRTG